MIPQLEMFENLSGRLVSRRDTMAQRRQRGWLKKETRIPGETWVLHFRTTRKSDGRRVENKIPIGLIRDLPDKRSAWAEVERLHLPINPVDSRRGVTFWRARTALRRTRTGRAVRIYPPKGAYHSKRLRPRPPKPLAPEMGQQNRAGYRTARSRGVADDPEEGRRA